MPGRGSWLVAVALLAALAAPAPATAAALPSPSVTFLTVHQQPGGGELRRATTTLIDVPTPLRVDDGASLDLLATVVALSTDRVTLVIDRLPGSRAPLPTSVEAIVRDPTGGDLGRQRVAVGYDARASRAPRHFRATARLGGSHLAVQQVTTGATEGLATIAELFDPGPGGTRLRPERIRVAFAPVAGSVSVDATLASPRVAVGVATSGPTAATIDGALDDGAGVRTLHAVVDRLPDRVNVSYAEDAGRPSLTYDASASIASIRARYEHRVGGELREAAVAAIAGLPGHLSFALTAAAAGALQASAPIGQVEIAAARNGEPLPVAGAQPGVRVVRRGDFASFGVRLRGLQAARVDAAGPLAVDATIARQPFGVSIVDAVGGLRVRGTIADLPARPSLRVDLAAGAIDYDGHGELIRRVALVARGRFGALRRVGATIDGLPSGSVRFAAKRNRPTRLRFAAARPLGTIDVVATSGRAPPRAPAGRDVVYYRDVRGAFVAHVRVTGLRGVSFAAPATGRGPLRASIARVGRRPIDVDVRARLRDGRAPIVVKGRLEGVPDRMRLRVEGRRSMHVAYDASAPLGAIHLTAGGGGLPALARRVRLDVRGLPRRLRIDQSRAGSVVAATADRPVGSLSIATASRGEARPVAGSGSGLRIAPTGLAVRLRGLRRVVVRTASPLRLDATLARQRFAVTVDDPRFLLKGTIADLPGRLSATIDLPRGTIAYDGHGDRIERVALEATARRALFARARRIALTVDGFPSGARVRFDRRSGSFAFDASRPLGAVDVSATDGTPVPPAPRGSDALYYRDLPGAYAVRVRLSGLRHVAYESDPVVVALRRASRLPVDVDVRTAVAGSATPLVVAGSLAGLPRAVRVTLRRAGRGLRAEYDASERLAALHLGARGGPLPATARHARLDILDLPRRVVVSVPGDGTFDARADGGVGSLGVAVAASGDARPVAGSGPGLRVVTDGPKAGIAVRLRGLERVELLDPSPLRVRATLARQPLAFTVDLPRAGQRLTGEIANLPRRLGLTIGPGASTIVYDGGGERLDRIAFEATARRPLFARARRVSGTIAGFPSGRLELGRDRSRFAYTASQPIGQIDVRASDGSAVPAGTAGHDRVYYRDVPGTYAVGVRVSGLRRVAFAAPQGSGGTVTAAVGRSSARPVDVDVRTLVSKAARAPLVLAGALSGVPRDVALALRTGAGLHATYRASAPLRALRLSASGPPLPTRLKRVTLDVRDVPERLELRMAPGSNAIGFDASRPIGRLRVVATDGCGPVPTFAGGADGVYYRDLRSRFAVRAQLTGLQRVAFAADPIEVTVARPGGRALRLDLLTRRGASPAASQGPRCPKPAAAGSGPRPLRLQGSLDGVPDELRMRLADGPDIGARYAASGPLERLSLLVRGVGKARNRGVLIRARDVPSRFDVAYREQRCGDPSPCGAFIRAPGPIGQVELKATGGRFLDLKPRGDRLVATTGKAGIEVAARVSNVRVLRAEVLHTPLRLTLGTDGGADQPPLVIDTRLTAPSTTWQGALGATLRDLPKVLRLCVDRGPACAESGEQAANSLLFSGDERPDGKPLRVRAVLCFKQVRPQDCKGPESARVVLVAALQRLGLELTPSNDGYAYVNTVPRGGGAQDALPIGGDIGYFSDERQLICFKLGEGARFARRKYLRPPPGSRTYGRGGGRSITFGGERPRIVCDERRPANGLRPLAMPDEEVPTDGFAAPGGR